MALRVLDGNQTATTLSSVVTGGEHIVAHSVVSLGANAIANITSAISGSVVSVSNFPSSQATTFGAITGSVSVLNFPSSQAVTFTQAPVTFGAVTASVSVLNFPSSQSVTFTAITGSASILNFPSNQAVTFGQASTTFGAVTGSVSILNFPASQSVTFGQTTVTGQVELGPTSLNALESITVTMGQVTVTGGLTNTELRASAVTIGGTVTVGNSITIGSLPDIAIGISPVYDSGDDSLNVNIKNIGGGASLSPSNTFPISGTVTANVSSIFGETDQSQFAFNFGDNFAQGVANFGSLAVSQQGPISGTVTVGNSVTIGSIPAISGTVTANVSNPVRLIGSNGDPIDDGGTLVVNVNDVASLPPISGTVTANGGDFASNNTDQPSSAIQLGFTNAGGDFVKVAEDSQFLPVQVRYAEPISGTVTAAAPNGSLTTRFGTPTTANVSFATAAVTKSDRKYLLIQNVTTGSNVITVGIGFTPTTTQGIQLTAGAGITFESSYIPTGAVYVLSSVTASNFTILEA